MRGKWVGSPAGVPAVPRHHEPMLRFKTAGQAEAGPIRDLAELVWTDTDSEWAIRWLIALLVLCCDPLATTLTAAASARRSTTVEDHIWSVVPSVAAVPRRSRITAAKGQYRSS
jgi:hypothetical protein